MLQIKNLSMNHTKDSHVLAEKLSFVLGEHDKAAIIGEEGNGKSTLLKLIYDPELIEDYIEYSGEIIRNGAVFGYLAQEISEKDKEKTIAEFCSENGFSELLPYEVYEIAMQLCIDADIFESERKMKTLSGGEKVKIRMAAVLAQKPDILLLDEPSMGLAPILVDQIFEIIKNLNKAGTTILLVEQNAGKSLAISDRAYVLENGNIVLTGTGTELAASEMVQKAYLGG